jgi:hypothetical protein
MLVISQGGHRMAGKFARSWELTKQAWSVLKEDKRLLIFPLISGTLTLLVICSAVGGLIAAIAAQGGFDTGAGGDSMQKLKETYGPWGYVALFVLYVVVYFIITFFQAALLGCAITKFDGGKPTIRGGLKMAATRIPQIFAWSLVNATVGVALNALKERVGFLGQIFLGLTTIAWNIATFFVVPALVIEGIGPIQAIKRSTSVIKKTWGETLITQMGVGTAMSLAGFLLFVILFGGGIGVAVLTGSPWPALIGFLVAIVVVLLMAIVQSAMKTLLIAATYRYAETGIAVGPFSSDQLQSMFKPKKK